MKMSKTNVNTGFAKSFILFITLVILLQGICYLGLSIWGLTLKNNCQNEAIDIRDNPLKFVVENLYFANEKCGNPMIILPEVNQTYSPEVNWSKSEQITNRVHVILITYMVIGGLCVITSFLVGSTLCCILTHTVSAVFYWPWFLVVMAGCVLDFVATFYFIRDIIHTRSADDYFAYAGIAVDNEIVSNYLKTYDAYFVTPAVIMTCVSSRLLFIWLLNIFGTIFCLSLSNVLAKQNAITVTESTQHIIEQHDQSNSPTQMRYHSNPTRNNNQDSIEVDLNARDASTYQKTYIHPDRLDYPLQSATTTEFPNISSELSSVSPLNQRYSAADGFHSSNQQQRASDELRSQLPWSYTNLPSKSQASSGRRLTQTSALYPEAHEPNHDQPAQGYTREKFTDYDLNRGPPQGYYEW